MRRTAVFFLYAIYMTKGPNILHGMYVQPGKSSLRYKIRPGLRWETWTRIPLVRREICRTGRKSCIQAKYSPRLLFPGIQLEKLQWTGHAEWTWSWIYDKICIIQIAKFSNHSQIVFIMLFRFMKTVPRFFWQFK